MVRDVQSYLRMAFRPQKSLRGGGPVVRAARVHAHTLRTIVRIDL